MGHKTINTVILLIIQRYLNTSAMIMIVIKGDSRKHYKKNYKVYLKKGTDFKKVS